MSNSGSEYIFMLTSSLTLFSRYPNVIKVDLISDTECPISDNEVNTSALRIRNSVFDIIWPPVFLNSTIQAGIRINPPLHLFE
ncbi:hypothetical protein SAMN05428947_102245 [Mucilaginibacter sp. OK283]|nr:hypothetical protein SAMN05428947_102245 [Mucilaginibacter sp. OK283]